jgi:hypothetical protein
LSSHAKKDWRKRERLTGELAKVFAGVSKRFHVVEETSCGKNTLWGSTNSLLKKKDEKTEEL